MMLSRQTRVLGMVLLISLFPAWLFGVAFMLVMIALNPNSNSANIILYHLFSYIAGSALVAIPLKYMCYLYPEIPHLYNPFLIKEEEEF